MKPNPGLFVVPVIAIVAAVVVPHLRTSPAPPAPNAPVARAAPAALTPDQAVGRKLELTIRCLNQLASSFTNLAQRYRSDVDPDTGPVAGKTTWFGRIDTQPCKTAQAEEAAIQPASPELDAAFAAYVASLGAAKPTLEQAADYYDQKRNLDDNAAKGKELHPKLIALFVDIAGRQRALGAAVDKLDRVRREARVAELAKDPARRPEFLRAKLMLLAEDTVRLGEVVDPAKLDRPAFDALVGLLETATKDVVALDVARSDNGFTNEAREFLAAALAVSRRAREAKPLSESERTALAGPTAWSVEGSGPALVHVYNELVDASNRFN